MVLDLGWAVEVDEGIGVLYERCDLCTKEEVVDGQRCRVSSDPMASLITISPTYAGIPNDVEVCPTGRSPARHSGETFSNSILLDVQAKASTLRGGLFVGCGLQAWRTKLIDLIGKQRRRKSILAVHTAIP